jgi:hypothetical protein
MPSQDIIFDRPGSPPDESALEQALGPVCALFTGLLTHVEGATWEWKFYGAKYGWQVKATKKKKALFYLVPCRRSFTFACAVRERERDSLLKSHLTPVVKKELLSAKKYAEGYPVRVRVVKHTDAVMVQGILDEILALR